MRKKTAILVCLLLCCMLVASAVVVAKPPSDKPGGGKPGGDDTPAGTLYFKYNDGSGDAVWTMKADGSDKTKLPLKPGLDHYYDDYTYNFGEISHLKHNDHYWFLRFEVIDGEYYPDGLPRREAFAVRDDNSIKAQMTDDPTLAPSHRDIGSYWSPADDFISWGAKKWVFDGSEWVLDDTQAGVFTATVQHDGNGDIIGASSPTLIWLVELTQDTDGYWRPRTGHNHDWSPDGTKFVWQRQGIQVVDLVARTETWITTKLTPRWSPDGNKIAFIRDGLWTINPDGSDEQLIVEAEDGRRIWKSVGDSRWSPDSLHISYNYRETILAKMTSKSWICRIEISSKEITKMTDDLPSELFKKNVDWR